MSISSLNTKVLGVFSLAMMTAMSVDSVRNLPATALFGSSLIFFFMVGAICFLIPCALVAAELASTCTEDGGVYVWVKKAFGQSTGFLAIWFQWIENVIWYPTILSFVAGTIAYLISPSLAENKIFLICVILCAFWGATFINLLGIKSSARFSNFCAITGLFLPMILIISLGITWFFSGKPLQINFSEHALLPHLGHPSTWVAMIGILLSFSGMEIATVHAHDVKNPQSAYPKAMLIASLLIIITLLLGSLSIAVVLPSTKINLLDGLMQAFGAFFSAYHLQYLLPLVAIMLVIGGMGGVNNWIIAPTRGLFIALEDAKVENHLVKKNKHEAPSSLLWYQAIIVSFVAGAFLLMPSVNGSYWLLTALAEQLYMIMYFLMFCAAIYLRYKRVQRRNGFMIPGGKYVGMWIVAGIGLLGTIAAFAIGFVPPSNIGVGGTMHFELLLILGLILMSTPPLIFLWSRRKIKR